MDIYSEYLITKKKYLDMKKNQVGGFKDCKIEDNDTILSVSHFFNSIVLKTHDDKIYKILLSTTYKNKSNDDEIKNEINILKILKKNIIDSGLSNHIIKIKKVKKCNNINKIFSKCETSFIEYIKKNNNITYSNLFINDKNIGSVSETIRSSKNNLLSFLENLKINNKNKICEEKYEYHPHKKYSENYKIIELEYCNLSAHDFIVEISKLTESLLIEYLNIFLFQILYTLLQCKKIYPNFVHGDLHLENILGYREQNNNNFYTYLNNDNIYYVPAKIFFPKINDFGLSTINGNINDVKYYDLYTILINIFDLLMVLFKNNLHKLKICYEYFNTFFDTHIILNTNNTNINNISDPEYQQYISIQDPEYLMDTYFYNIFGKHNKNIATFGKN